MGGGFIDTEYEGVDRGSGTICAIQLVPSASGTSSGGDLILGAEVTWGTDVWLLAARDPDARCLRAVELVLNGKSLRAAKLRGLLPRTITAPECASAMLIFPPVDNDAMIFK